MNMETNDFILQARQAAINWAQDLVKRDPTTWVILDTETTGLGEHDEIVQVGMINGAGIVLIDNLLIKPTVPIGEGARQVHGISDKMVLDAPRFSVVWPLINSAMIGKHLVIYNADYDLRMLKQSAKALNFPIGYYGDGWSCAMNRYAEFVGEWNSYHGSFRWQRLPSGDHSALGDCRSVLKLIKVMADGEP